MNYEMMRKGRSCGWGVYLATALVVAALCVSVMFYLGYFDNRPGAQLPSDRPGVAAVNPTPQS